MITPNDTFRWKHHTWHVGHLWGGKIPLYHPKENWQWHNNAYDISDDDNLNVKLVKHTKVIPGFGSPKFGASTIRLPNIFYGRYEFYAKFPADMPGAWATLWMSGGKHGGEGELDFAEGNANIFSGYFPYLIKYNVHLDQYTFSLSKEKLLGRRSVIKLFSKPSSAFCWYGFDWTANKLDVLFDGKIIASFTDDKYLKHFRSPRDLAISYGIKRKYVWLANFLGPKESNFVIDNIKFIRYA